jgi:hypothetical protein
MVEITRLDVDASRGRTCKASVGVRTVVVVGADTDVGNAIKAEALLEFPKGQRPFLTEGHTSYRQSGMQTPDYKRVARISFLANTGLPEYYLGALPELRQSY